MHMNGMFSINENTFHNKTLFTKVIFHDSVIDVAKYSDYTVEFINSVVLNCPSEKLHFIGGCMDTKISEHSQSKEEGNYTYYL